MNRSISRDTFGQGPFSDPFFEDARKILPKFGNQLENPQFSEDAPVMRNDKKEGNLSRNFSPYEDMHTRWE